jgi:methylisocitrate lyase
MDQPGPRAGGRACIACPGAFNGLSARAVARAGFDACYVSGAATSVCAGVPDVGLLTLDHFARVVREVCQNAARPRRGNLAPGSADPGGGAPALDYLPVLADADTGFGEAEMVRRTVIEYARAGAAGLHIEDQAFPKRCGHLDGKQLVPADHMVEKIHWAVKAARDFSSRAPSPPAAPAEGATPRSPGSGPADPNDRGRPAGFIICARTDAAGVDGLDAAVERARAYAAAGADMIFPEGLASEADFARFAQAMCPPATPRPPYLLANMTEFGKTPIIPLDRFQEMGYSLVIYPVTLLRVAMGALTRALDLLRGDGSAARLLEDMQTRQQLYDLIGYRPGVPWELPAAG